MNSAPVCCPLCSGHGFVNPVQAHPNSTTGRRTAGPRFRAITAAFETEHDLTMDELHANHGRAVLKRELYTTLHLAGYNDSIIAQVFGRDHTTILHHRQKAAALGASC